MHAPQIDAAMVLCARAGGKRTGFGRLFCLYYRCCMRVKSEPRITLIYVMGCDWVLVGWWVAGGGGLCVLVGVRPRSAPGPHPNPLPAERERGLLVAIWRDCCIKRGGGLVGMPPRRPEPSPQPSPVQRERGNVCGRWGVQVGTRRVDFFVEEVVLVELKAVSELDDVHLVQVRNYLEVFGLEVGLLSNFGCRSLEFKRLRNGV